jgi:hypothetical protein
MRRCLIALAVVLVAGHAALRAGEVTDVQAKAAFLLNVTRFVDWPVDDAKTLTICDAADDALHEAIEQIVRGRTVNGRELRLRRVAVGEAPGGCQVMFLASLQPSDAAEVLRQTHGPVLTIGETLQFLRDGGMVRVFIEQQRIRFQIDHKAAQAAGLKISAQLLMLAAR